MKRRDFLTGATAAVLLAACPGLAAPDEPMGLLGLIDDDTYAPSQIWARSSLVSGAFVTGAIGQGALARWVAWERTALEAEASERYGRPVRFEVIDEDGQVLRQEPHTDAWRVLFRERRA
jgi:hypothetical protein